MIKIKEIICPVCGRSIHEYHHFVKSSKVLNKTYRIRDDVAIHYLDYLDSIYDMDRDYFAIERDTGKSGFGNITNLGPEDWEEGFVNIKKAMFRAMKYYINKGWITKEELDTII